MESPCPLMTPTVEFSVSLIEKNRQRMLKAVAGFPLATLIRIPPGFHNNLLWNLGHIIASQQILCYEKSGLPLRIPAYFITPFRKGSHPGQWTGTMDPEDITAWLMESVKLLREDLHKGLFHTYEPYETSSGVKLGCISDALTFCAGHEAEHLGVMLALRKLVSP